MKLAQARNRNILLTILVMVLLAVVTYLVIRNFNSSSPAPAASEEPMTGEEALAFLESDPICRDAQPAPLTGLGCLSALQTGENPDAGGGAGQEDPRVQELQQDLGAALAALETATEKLEASSEAQNTNTEDTRLTPVVPAGLADLFTGVQQEATSPGGPGEPERVEYAFDVPGKSISVITSGVCDALGIDLPEGRDIGSVCVFVNEDIYTQSASADIWRGATWYAEFQLTDTGLMDPVAASMMMKDAKVQEMLTLDDNCKIGGCDVVPWAVFVWRNGDWQNVSWSGGEVSP